MTSLLGFFFPKIVRSLRLKKEKMNKNIIEQITLKTYIDAYYRVKLSVVYGLENGQYNNWKV